MNDEGPALTMSGGLGVLKRLMRCFLLPAVCYGGGRHGWIAGAFFAAFFFAGAFFAAFLADFFTT